MYDAWIWIEIYCNNVKISVSKNIIRLLYRKIDIGRLCSEAAVRISIVKSESFIFAMQCLYILFF